VYRRSDNTGLSPNLQANIYFSIFPLVLYGCETWSLTLREEHRLRVFKNRVLRRIFGPKRGEVTGGWRKLRKEELHNLYSSPSIIRMVKSRRMRWSGHVAQMDEKRNAYMILVRKSEGKRPVGRPRSRWVANIKMDLREIGWNRIDWIDLAQDRNYWKGLVNTVMNTRGLSNAGKFLSDCTIGGFSRRAQLRDVSYITNYETFSLNCHRVLN
jgi:hypothetical protein